MGPLGPLKRTRQLSPSPQNPSGGDRGDFGSREIQEIGSRAKPILAFLARTGGSQVPATWVLLVLLAHRLKGDFLEAVSSLLEGEASNSI